MSRDALASTSTLGAARRRAGARCAWELGARAAAGATPRCCRRRRRRSRAAWQRLTAGRTRAAMSASSLGRIVAGFALGAVAGRRARRRRRLVPRASARIVRPIVELLRPIPPLAWIPIAIVWFGLGEPSKIFVIFLGAFFPIFTNAWRGMTVDSARCCSRPRARWTSTARAAVRRSRCPPRCPTSRPACASASACRFGDARRRRADRGRARHGLPDHGRAPARPARRRDLRILLIGVVTLVADAILAALLRRWLGSARGGLMRGERCGRSTGATRRNDGGTSA